jgi:hypothetical protein
MAGEISPGSASPLVQGPLETQQPETLPLGLQNPDTNLPLPTTGTPNADISPPVQRPATVAGAEPPDLLGPQQILIQQASRDLPLSLAGSQQPNQANMVPLVAFPVLSRMGPQGTSWAAPVAIAGLSTVNIRGTYRDLKITPGFRGIQIQYPIAAVGRVTIIENTTGMIYTLPSGPQTFFLPLFMLREIFDITILGPGGAAFPVGSTCLLTTEEQIPFVSG